MHHLTAALENVSKGATATRRDWYLTVPQIKLLLQNCPTVQLLVFIVLELMTGGRPESTTTTKWEAVKFEQGFISYFESKKKNFGERWLIPEVIALLQRYKSDLELKSTSVLFPKISKSELSRQFKLLGQSVGIELFDKEGAASYVLRHTFATQASDHDVSLEVVMEQGGWTESSTLLAHYVSLKSSKKKRELLGIATEKQQNFGDWIRQFTPLWESRYTQLRSAS